MTFYGCNWCNTMVQVIYGCDTLKWSRFCLFFRHFLKVSGKAEVSPPRREGCAEAIGATVFLMSS